MFLRKLQVTYAQPGELGRPVPVDWLDSFAMRNFTNDAVFDDTLPVADGLLEAGLRVPLPALAAALELWLRRKGRLRAEEQIQITELSQRLTSRRPHPK